MEINPDQCSTTRREMEIKTLCDEKTWFNICFRKPVTENSV